MELEVCSIGDNRRNTIESVKKRETKRAFYYYLCRVNVIVEVRGSYHRRAACDYIIDTLLGSPER